MKLIVPNIELRMNTFIGQIHHYFQIALQIKDHLTYTPTYINNDSTTHMKNR